MSRAGPVRRAGSFSRDPSTSEKHTKNHVCHYMEKSQHDAGIPANRAKIFSCNRLHRDSPVSQASNF